MSNLIQVKRSTDTAAPSTLNFGELAWSENGAIAFVGNSTSGIVAFGGARFPGVATANQALVLSGTGYLDVVRLGNSTANAVSNSVKMAYANSTASANVTPGGLVVGTSVVNATVLAAGANVIANTTALFVGNSTVSAIVNSTNITVGNATFTGVDCVQLPVGNTGQKPSGANGQVRYNNETDNFDAFKAGAWTTLSTGGSIAGANTQVEFNDSGVFGASAGFTFDKAANNLSVANNVLVGANVSVGTVRIAVGNSTVNVTANSLLVQAANSTGTANLQPTQLLVGTTVVNSTALAAGANVVLTTATVTVGNSTVNTVANSVQISTRDAVLSGNVTAVNINATANVNAGIVNATDLNLTGNLSVLGTLVTVDATNLQVKDSLIRLADGNLTVDVVDEGLYYTYGNSTVTQYGGLFRDASDSGIVKAFEGAIPEPTTTVNTANVNFAFATFQAWLKSGALVSNSSVLNVTANSTIAVALVANTLTLTTALGAAYGGTGQLGGYSVGDLLYASGATTLSKLAKGTAGKVLQSDGSTPVYADLDGGTF